MFNILLPSWALPRLLLLGLSMVKRGSSQDEEAEVLQGHCPSASLLGPLLPTVADITCPELIDDETIHHTGSWSPWSHPPTCIEPRTKTEPKLCTYSHTSFRGMSGLSIVATPEIAANIVGLLEDVDAKWIAQGRCFAAPANSPPGWTVTKIEGKGLGAIANRTFAKDEIIMTELPLFCRPMDSGKWEYRAMTELLAAAGNNLPRRDRARIISMARAHGGDFLDDVLNTNSYSISLDGHEFSGLFPNIARINHACEPNAFVRFNPRALAMEVVAYREIRAGEEFALSYIPMNLGTEDRQAILQRWGFKCSCSLCSSPSKSKVSDRRRQRIEDIMGQLGHYSVGDHKATGKLTDEIVELCKLEGMLALTGDVHVNIALAWERVGDLELARKHARLAVERLKHYAGEDNERTENAVQFLKQLE